MLVNVGNDTVWEVIPEGENQNKAILRGKSDLRKAMTIPMDGFKEWYYDNLEDLQNIPEHQTRIIFAMRKWGQSTYSIKRESKIIFS